MIRRLTYTPEVHAFINITEPKNPNYGRIIDVSQDIIGGSVTRNLEAVSTAELRLQNKNGKYLGGYSSGRGEAFAGYLFTPMDKIIITMARFGDPFRVFTGYLDEVPAFQLYPDQVTLRASCPIKRLMYTYLDPGLPFFYHFLRKNKLGYDQSSGTIYAMGDLQFGNLDIAGNIGELIYDLLTDTTVGAWDPSTVHIINFPRSFYDAVSKATNNYRASDLTSGKADGASSNQATNSSNGNSNSSGNDYTQGFHVSYNDITQGLIARGMSPLDAIALSGRTTQENQRWTSNVPVHQDSQGDTVGGFGLFQWNGGRATNLIAFAKQHGGNPVDLRQQLDFLIYENNTSQKDAWRSVTQAPTLNDKVVAFTSNWEQGSLGYAVSYALDAQTSIKTLYPNIDNGLSPSDIQNIQDASDNNDQKYAISPYITKQNTSDAFTSFPRAETIVGLAESQLGISEQPPGTNSGPQVNSYLSSAGVDINAAAKDKEWCAAFVYWIFHKAGLKVPRTAGVKAMWSGLKSYQQIPNNGTNKPQPGDMVFYGSSPGSLYHIGIVTRVDSDSTFTAIEGNTSNNAVQGSGDTTVAKHTYSLSDRTVYGFGRITNDSNKIGIDVASSANGNPASGGNKGIGDGIPDPSNSQLAYGIVPYLRSTPAPNFSLSNALDTAHGLVDAIPLLQLIQDYTTGAMRTFCTGPDGDFYSFFPDYFGWFGTTPYFKIEDIELISLNVQLTDENLQTHVFGVGPVLGYNAISLFDYAVGPIASVEEKAFQVFVKTNPNIPPGPTGSINPQDIINTFYTKDNFNSEDFMQRYGARPLIQQFDTIRMPEMLWLATWYQFLQSWASTYISEAEFTFMPELFPGGRINVADRISFYIQSVTHEFDFQGGFTTSATLTAATVEDTTMDGEAQRTIQEGLQVGK